MSEKHYRVVAEPYYTLDGERHPVEDLHVGDVVRLAGERDFDGDVYVLTPNGGREDVALAVLEEIVADSQTPHGLPAAPETRFLISLDALRRAQKALGDPHPDEYARLIEVAKALDEARA